MTKITIRSYDYDIMCERVEVFTGIKPVDAMKEFSKKYPSCQTLLLDVDFEEEPEVENVIDQAFPVRHMQKGTIQ